MTKIHFKGRVLPEHRRVSIPHVNPLKNFDANRFEAEVAISIVQGRVTIACRSINGTELEPQMCIVRAYECATALVDLYAFTKGWALSVLLDYMYIEERRVLIATSETSVQKYCTVMQTDDEFRNVWSIVLGSGNLKFALRDLISSLSTLNYSSIAVGRSIEAIRQLLAPTGATEKMA